MNVHVVVVYVVLRVCDLEGSTSLLIFEELLLLLLLTNVSCDQTLTHLQSPYSSNSLWLKTVKHLYNCRAH